MKLNKITKNIPGFRSKKVWKMIIASLFYLLSLLLLIIGGYQYFLCFLSFTVMIGYCIEMLIESLSGNSVKEFRVRFIVSLMVLFVSTCIFMSTYQ